MKRSFINCYLVYEGMEIQTLKGKVKINEISFYALRKTVFLLYGVRINFKLLCKIEINGFILFSALFKISGYKIFQIEMVGNNNGVFRQKEGFGVIFRQ